MVLLSRLTQPQPPTVQSPLASVAQHSTGAAQREADGQTTLATLTIGFHFHLYSQRGVKPFDPQLPSAPSTLPPRPLTLDQGLAIYLADPCFKLHHRAKPQLIVATLSDWRRDIYHLSFSFSFSFLWKTAKMKKQVVFKDRRLTARRRRLAQCALRLDRHNCGHLLTSPLRFVKERVDDFHQLSSS